MLTPINGPGVRFPTRESVYVKPTKSSNKNVAAALDEAAAKRARKAARKEQHGKV